MVMSDSNMTKKTQTYEINFSYNTTYAKIMNHGEMQK